MPNVAQQPFPLNPRILDAVLTHIKHSPISNGGIVMRRYFNNVHLHLRQANKREKINCGCFVRICEDRRHIKYVRKQSVGATVWRRKKFMWHSWRQTAKSP